MTEANRYEIKKLRDFNKIPPERMEAAFVDFASWLGFVRMAEDGGDMVADALAVRATIEALGFTWIDDGRNDAKITIQTEVNHK